MSTFHLWLQITHKWRPTMRLMSSTENNFKNIPTQSSIFTTAPEVPSLGSSGSGVLLWRLDISPRLRCLCLRLYWNSAYSWKQPQKMSLKKTLMHLGKNMRPQLHIPLVLHKLLEWTFNGLNLQTQGFYKFSYCQTWDHLLIMTTSKILNVLFHWRS